MSQHGCPERLSNRSKGFQEDGPSQPTMELMVETLTGTAFEMTVSPSDTIFAIKSKIFRVEGIPVAQQHLLYNLRELDDALSLREHAIGDGARLRLVLGLRGGPMATRRLPPPEPWRDIERLLHPRSSSEWGDWGECRVTVLVFREGERVNMLRVRENRDGSYSPLDLDRPHLSNTSSSSINTGNGGATPERRDAWGGAGGSEARRENALTAGKMVELRRRMEALSVSRRRPPRNGDKPDIQKTRSEETLSVPSLLDESDNFNHMYCETFDLDRYTLLPPIAQDEDRLKLSVLVKRDNEEGAILEECLDTEEFVDSALANNLTPVPTAEYSGVGVEGAGVGGWRAFGSSSQLAPPPLAHALFSSSTGDLEALRRNRILPALSRHRNREHLHLSDEGLHLPPPPAPPRSRAVGSERRRGAAPPPAPPAPEPHVAEDVQEKVADKIVKKVRLRCGFCRKRLTVATVHECRCGVRFCAPHRYAEVHGCAYDYKRAPQLPRI